jgi:hypothetical protein
MSGAKKKSKRRAKRFQLTAAWILWCTTAGYLAFLGVAAWFFSTTEHRRMLNFMSAIPHWDKYFHFCATGTLSFFVNLLLSFRVLRIAGLPFLWGTWLVIFMACSEEYSQSYIPGRVFDIWDLAAAAAGAIVFGRLAMFIYRKEFRQPILRKLRWFVRQSTQYGPPWVAFRRIVFGARVPPEK